MLRPDTLALTALLGLLTALGPLATDMYLPSLPAIGTALHASTSQVQVTLSIFLAGFAAGQIVYGPLSDRFGRRPPLIAGLALFVVASLLCALAPTIGLLHGARFLQALGGSGPIVLARAVVRDLYEGPRAGRELSRMGTIMGLVPAVAPILGGVMQNLFGWQSTFVLAAALAAGGGIVVMRKLPETLRTRNLAPISPASIARGYASLARHRGFVAYTALMSLTYAGLFSWISASSFVLQGAYRLTEVGFGIAFSVGVLGYLSGTLAAQALVQRIGIERTMAAGTLCLAAGGVSMLGLVLLGTGHAAEIVLPMALYLAGVGLVMPQAMAGAMAPFPDRAGAASSFAGFVQMLCGAVVGAGVGLALGASALALPVAVAATGLAATAIFHLTKAVRGAAAAR